VPVHIVGNSGRSVVAIHQTRPFHAVLRVAGAASPDGTLASARVSCPRKGCVDGAECVDCVHLQAWRATPEVRLYCSVDDRESVTSFMRTRPPATTVDTRCPAADEFAAARGVHHLLVFDRRLELAGVVCRCDFARGGDRAVGAAMSPEVFAVEASTSLGVAAAAMRELHIGCLPVVRGPLVLGILTRRDLDRAGVPV
jgi:CBS domain-containing protein